MQHRVVRIAEEAINGVKELGQPIGVETGSDIAAAKALAKLVICLPLRTCVPVG
jgi:hypothetical protein